MAARKRSTNRAASATVQRSRRRRTPKPLSTPSWKADDWKSHRVIQTNNVEVIRSVVSRELFVVKKVLKRDADAKGARTRPHFEVRVLAHLPECNRITKMLETRSGYPDIESDTILFEYHPLGDLRNWKSVNFDTKNCKPVPETYIWRFYVQMVQALAFIHNEIGPDQEKRFVILHRDIKPKNILVVDNGTTYPSFKLHDFGCGTVPEPGKENKASYCGSFDWQPPENPLINTKAADIWAIGACVHYLATGKAPIREPKETELSYRNKGHEEWPASLKDYSATDRYWSARTERQVLPICFEPEMQVAEEMIRPGDKPYPTYSEELDAWMRKTLKRNQHQRAKTKHLLNKMVPVAKEMIRQGAGSTGLVDLEVTFGDGVPHAQ